MHITFSHIIRKIGQPISRMLRKDSKVPHTGVSNNINSPSHKMHDKLLKKFFCQHF